MLLEYLLILGTSGRCIFLAIDRIKHASSAIVVMQKNCPSHTLPFVLVCQGKFVPSQNLVVYYIKSLLRPGSNILSKSRTSIDIIRVGLILRNSPPACAAWCAQALIRALFNVIRLPSVWRAAMVSLRWYQDTLLSRLVESRGLGITYPRFSFLGNFTVSGLGTTIKFSRRSTESPLCAKFFNGTVRSFFPIHRRYRELYSFAPLSFTRWLEVMVYGWNDFEIGLLEVQRNNTGVVTGVRLQCGGVDGPYWFARR